MFVSPKKLFFNWITLYYSDSVKSKKLRTFIVKINDRKKKSRHSISTSQHSTIQTTQPILAICKQLCFHLLICYCHWYTSWDSKCHLISYRIVNLFMQTMAKKKINTRKLAICFTS